MQITRRAFSQGIGGLLGAHVAPGGKAVSAVLPIEPGFEDAYEKLLSEYIRVEETAIAAGRTAGAQVGASTWEGRQLEGFIAELDGRMDVQATARQIFGEFKERFRAEAAKLRARLDAPQSVEVDEAVDAPATEVPAEDALPLKGDADMALEATSNHRSVEPADVSGHPVGDCAATGEHTGAARHD